MIIGADGGGTKTNLIAVDADSGKQLAVSTAGSIHSYSLGMETAVANMEIGLKGLGLEPDDRIVAISIGDPALDDSDPAAGEPLRRQMYAQGLCPSNAACFSKSDVFMALYAFSGGAPGALLVAGTGSMGVALSRPYCHGGDNTLLTVGGWGQPTNDPGSGCAIAVGGITAAMNAFDGVAPATSLCEEALAFYGVASPRELIDVFNGPYITRSKIAAFATRVDACAQAGDAVAAAILTEAGEMLGRYGLSMLRQMEGAERRLGLYGSVLVNNAGVRAILTETVRKEYPEASVTVLTRSPEYGAARFAADALGIRWEE